MGDEGSPRYSNRWVGSESRTASAVILFDIDGTLLRRAGPRHRKALVSAVLRVTGVETSNDHIATQGMLDSDILDMMLREAGISARAARKAMPAIMREAEVDYHSECPDLRRKVCPGVRRFLSKLPAAETRAGLVTGNLPLIGWRKMERAGLRHHFSFGAFAGQGKDRAELVKVALKNAKADGWLRRNTPVALVGDHPNDVNAAKANGVRSVAVATGLVGRDELAAHSPDFLVDDLSHLRLEDLFS